MLGKGKSKFNKIQTKELYKDCKIINPSKGLKNDNIYFIVRWI